MKTSAFPTLTEVRTRHDALIDRLRTARTAGGLSPVEIPPDLAQETAGFIAELHGMGAALYADGDRSATQSLMAYWINALYRAEWYQRRDEEPPAPELAAFAPEAQPPLTDEDYPWPRCDHCGATPDLPTLWQRLSAMGLEILKARRVLGVTGAAGCGRSNLIATSLVPVLRQGGLGELVEHSLTPDEDFAGGANADQDFVFLSPLLRLARSVAGTSGPALDAAGLVRDPAALARLLDATGQRHLVVVQDLHHLFMLSDDPFELEPSAGQRAFIEALTRIATSEAGHYVVVDVQTDYLARLRAFSELHQILERPIGASGSDGWLIVSLESQELRHFIVEPADRVGLHFEAGLVDRIVLEHQSEPAAITILLFTLRRLWTDMLTYQDRRNMIVWQNYQRVGSGRLVLELAADGATKAVLDGEAPEEKPALDAIRRVFIELVRLMPGSAWWLPRVSRAAIEAALAQAGHPAARVQRIVAEFMRVGLFVESQPGPDGTTLRIFHDALVGRWTRLVQWLENERTTKRLRWLLRGDARDWNHLLRPAPSAKTGWRDALGRFHRRLSRLWHGSKLREARAFRDLSAREERFLRISRRVWYATLLARTAGAAAVPVVLILAFASLAQHLRSVGTTLLMDRGINLIAEGDPGLAACLLAEAHRLDSLGPREILGEARGLGRLVTDWLPSSRREGDLVHRASIGMASRRLPILHNLTTVPDGLAAAEISPSGRFAVLGCSKQKESPGQVLLWDIVDGTRESLLGEKDDISVDRVVFARRKGEFADTLFAVAGSIAGAEKGVVLVWDLRNRAVPPARIATTSRVRDMAFHPGPADADRMRLVIATGADPSRGIRGTVDLFRLSAASGQLGVTKETELLPPPAPAEPAAGGSGAKKAEASPTRLAFSSRGTLAIALAPPASDSGSVAILEESGDAGGWKRTDLSDGLLPVTDLAFSSEADETLALATAKTGNGSGEVRVFRRNQTAWSEPGPALQLGGEILKVAFSPVGGSLLATSASGAVGIWSFDGAGVAKRGREISEGGWPFSAAWSPDGRWVAIGNRDRHARLWDTATGRLVLPPLYHGATVSSVSFTPDGLRMLVTTAQTARLWSTAPREFSLLPVRAAEQASQAILSADGRHVAVTSTLSGYARDGVQETELTVWRDRELVPAHRSSHDSALVKIAISGDGTILAALTQKSAGKPARQEVLVWEIPSVLKTTFVWKTASSRSWKIPVEPGADFLGIVPGSTKPKILVAGSALAAAGEATPPGFLQVLDLSQEKPAAPIPLKFRVKSFAASRDGKLAVIGGDGGASTRGGFIATVDVSSSPSRVHEPLDCHDEAVMTLGLSADGRRLLSGSLDDTVKLLAVGNDGAVRIIDGQKRSGQRVHTADITSVGFNHDGRRAVSTGRDSAAILYDVTDDRLDLLARMEQRGIINHHAFSPDDRWLTTGGEDGVTIWYAGSGQKQLQGSRVAALPHRYPVAGLAFAAAGGLRTVALERSAGGASFAQVEAGRWSVEPDGEKEIVGRAELLAGRKLVGMPPSPVNLSPDQLQALWRTTAGRGQEVREPAEELRNQALAAATASQWKAARKHVLAWRTADRQRFNETKDTLMFAVEVFEAARDPANVRITAEALLPMVGHAADQQRRYVEKRAMASVQLARNSIPSDREQLLSDASADFQKLASIGIRAWWLPLCEAEIHVLREDWPRALERLEESKRLLDGAEDAERQQTAGSQDQRIAAIHLIQAAEAKKNGDTDLAAREDAAWLALARKAMEEQRNATPTARARVAWPLVLGATGDAGVIDTALAFAEAGFKERPGSYARTNTYAASLLRAGRVEEAEKNLIEAVRLFEQEEQKTSGQPSERKQRTPGRPSDWIIHSLILIARSGKEDGEKKSATLKEAREQLQRARAMINNPPEDAQSEWRATWNNLDLRVLVAEAERKLGPHEAP